MKRFSTRGAISLSMAVGLTISGAVAASLIVSGSAGAAGPKPSDTCKTIKRQSTTVFILSGCKSDRDEPGTETGGGTLTQTSSTTATLMWKAPFEGGEVVQITGITVTQVGGPPPQPADEVEPRACPTGTQELVISGTVGPGSEDATATASAEACATSAGALSQEPGSLYTISEPTG